MKTPTQFFVAYVFSGLMLSVILSHGCSLEERKSSGHRGHTEKFSGVEHGFAAVKAQRFCKECHGATLAGGENGQPSCYQCHGRNWHDVDAATSAAPEDHTTVMGGYTHHPSLHEPAGFCTNCHGANLTGEQSRLSPSCYLCHAKNWNN